MAKWRLNQAPELIAVPIESREYAQVLAGISEILYRVTRQLDSKKKDRPLAFSIGTNVNPHPQDAQLKTEEAHGSTQED